MSVWSNSQPWPSVDVEFSTGDNLRLPEDAQMLKPHFFPAIPRPDAFQPNMSFAFDFLHVASYRRPGVTPTIFYL
ncbi:uncharacterized protein F5891DRAFT_1184311 [Suillus fuscotomentosus]|uniref:Uncharacterized protein n=1 Tax=Suillus fuscotomentosus TaxID=1912939 RepID=A0AAD4EDA5_9AGAM|nr:uncharacterized protein F5891DRAFT_1184311 [Suillus fuscotomentosus]KAG1904134.1 hypothetical protein F5891DRAFT_1184311 [Suillus fuscotomentosus]